MKTIQVKDESHFKLKMISLKEHMTIKELVDKMIIKYKK